jgi:hypothetical protein
MVEQPSNDTSVAASTQQETEAKSLDLQIKQAELEIRRVELENAKRASSRINWSIVVPALAAIGAAFIAFISNTYVANLDRSKLLLVEDERSKTQFKLEKIKLQTNLIISAVSTGDTITAAKNLKFFVEIGFIDDPEGKIAKLTEQGQSPVLPAARLDMGDDPKARLPTTCSSDANPIAHEIKQEQEHLYIQSCVYYLTEGKYFNDGKSSYYYIYGIENKNTENPVMVRWNVLAWNILLSKA